MDENTGQFLSQQLYPDLKNWIPTLLRKLRAPLAKRRSPEYDSPADLLNALSTNRIGTDTWVRLKCKPLSFGPFLRSHFLSPVIGHHTSMRLGPQLTGNNALLAMLGQATTHLKPVGLFPPIDNDLYQICLYPSDANVVGMMGLLPGINNLVRYIPAVTSSNNITFCGMACNVSGIIRQAPAKLFTDLGLPIERWEECRQAGDIWFLDLSSEGTESEPIGRGTCTEIWGGMYASGHLEIKAGRLQLLPVVSRIRDILQDSGFEPHVMQDQGKIRDIMIYSKGCRLVFGTRLPIFSIHMDSELAIQYGDNRRKFDRICESVLSSIRDVCKSQSVELGNPNDLDFTYTDSAKAFTVLRSCGSEYIADPLLVAIRDWHRTRGK